MRSIRPLLNVIGCALLIAMLASTALALGSPKGSRAGSKGCGRQAARRALTAHGKTSGPAPIAVLCGPFAGRGSATMIAALPAGKCRNQGNRWIAFRRGRGGWRKVWAYRGIFTAIAAGPVGSTGTRIRETAPKESGRRCAVTGSRWRLWRWNGRRFVAGPWHEGSSGKGGHQRLVLSPNVKTITAGETVRYRVNLYEGTRDLGDVTDRTTLGMEYVGSPSVCGSPTTTRTTAYCEGLGSCDQSAHTCTAVSPGEWILVADLESSYLDSQYASLTVQPKNNLTISPSQIPNGIFGIHYEQQFGASGASEPVTWEANRYTKSGARVPLAFPPGIGETFYGSIDPSTGSMSAATWPSGPQQVVVRAWDGSGDSGEETVSFTAEAPYCSTVCLYAGPQGELSLAWRACGCTSVVGGRATYAARATIDGVPNSYRLGLDVTELFGGGQFWETFAPGDHSLSQQAGETISVAVEGVREIENSEGETEYEYIPVGTSNAVVVK